MKELLNQLSAEFEDCEYAHAYMEDNLVTRLAAQIYALRKQRGWSQQDLARRSGIAQERISKIESADFESLTLKTLHKFSRAFDVNLTIQFNEFSKGLLDIVNLNPELLKVPSRKDDLEKLNRLQLKFDSNGKWRSVQQDKLLEITSFNSAPTTPIPTKLDEWTHLLTHPVKSSISVKTETLA